MQYIKMNDFILQTSPFVTKTCFRLQSFSFG